MIDFISAMIYIYIFIGLCMSLLLVFCLKSCNEYEIKDMIANSGLDQKETEEILKKSFDRYNKNPYLWFAVSVLTTVPILIFLVIKDFKSKGKFKGK